MFEQNFDFSTHILNDNIIQNYKSFSIQIHTKIINTKDETYPLQFSNIAVFPLLVYVRGGFIDIVHHVTPSSKNILTKTNGNFKAILGLRDNGLAIEIKGLKTKKFSTGKIIKLENLFNISNKEELSSLDFIEHNI
jgi:hypothetical protein